MKKQFLKAGIAAIIMSTVLAGCGSSKYEYPAALTKDASDVTGSSYFDSKDIYVNSSTADSGSYDYEVAEVEEDYAEDIEAAPVEAGGSAPEVTEPAKSNRKLIRNASLDVETEQFDELMATVEQKTKALGGYIEDSYTYNGRNYYNNKELKNANLTIRIPSEKLDEFLSAVSEKSNVTSKNESVTDVTLRYVDLESHKKVLEAEQERLIEMMEQADTVEDMITIESRLSEVRYELESQESQLRTYDNQINYSTVSLNVHEVEKYSPQVEDTFWQKISRGFSDNLVNLLNGLVEFVIWLISSLPFLIFWGVILFFVIRAIIRSIRNKRERKARGIDKKTQKAEHKALKAQKKAEKKAKREAKAANAVNNAGTEAAAEKKDEAESKEENKEADTE